MINPRAIALHEAAHAVCAADFGSSIISVSLNPPEVRHVGSGAMRPVIALAGEYISGLDSLHDHVVVAEHIYDNVPVGRLGQWFGSLLHHIETWAARPGTVEAAMLVADALLQRQRLTGEEFARLLGGQMPKRFPQFAAQI